MKVYVIKKTPELKDPGYIWVPYIPMSTTEGPSPEYKEFMDNYRKKHEYCPNCGGKKGSQTLMGYVLDIEKPEDYQNKNIFNCSECGHKCSVHNKISYEEALEMLDSKIEFYRIQEYKLLTNK